MAVTNRQIIAAECIDHGITEEVNTYAGWQVRGFQVEKGSKAVFKTKIWKPCKVKNKDGEQSKKLLLVNAAFFTASQVKAI